MFSLESTCVILPTRSSGKYLTKCPAPDPKSKTADETHFVNLTVDRSTLERWGFTIKQSNLSMEDSIAILPCANSRVVSSRRSARFSATASRCRESGPHLQFICDMCAAFQVLKVCSNIGHARFVPSYQVIALPAVRHERRSIPLLFF
jgi:hypothetical protein